jgi:protein-L-isoaspartate(D-aspartate) O-methyltransferase
MHAHCLDLMEDHLKPGAKALDVGSGTGYLTACMGLMIENEGGKVIGVEHIRGGWPKFSRNGGELQ